VNSQVTPAQEEKVAKLASLAVKVGALLCILLMPTKFALDLQLLGGVWILQTFPSLVFGLFSKRLRAPALLAGWFAGIFCGTWTAWADGIKPVHSLVIGGDKFTIYTGLLALAVNFIVAIVVQALLRTPAPAPVPSKA